jgi:hypothetical protein
VLGVVHAFGELRPALVRRGVGIGIGVGVGVCGMERVAAFPLLVWTVGVGTRLVR